MARDTPYTSRRTAETRLNSWGQSRLRNRPKSTDITRSGGAREGEQCRMLAPKSPCVAVA